MNCRWLLGIVSQFSEKSYECIGEENMYFERGNFDLTLVNGFTKELRDFPQDKRNN